MARSSDHSGRGNFEACHESNCSISPYSILRLEKKKLLGDGIRKRRKRNAKLTKWFRLYAATGRSIFLHISVTRFGRSKAGSPRTTAGLFAIVELDASNKLLTVSYADSR